MYNITHGFRGVHPIWNEAYIFIKGETKRSLIYYVILVKRFDRSSIVQLSRRGSRSKLAGKSVFLQIIGNDNANIYVFFSTTYLLITAISKPKSRHHNILQVCKKRLSHFLKVNQLASVLGQVGCLLGARWWPIQIIHINLI